MVYICFISAFITLSLSSDLIMLFRDAITNFNILPLGEIRYYIIYMLQCNLLCVTEYMLCIIYMLLYMYM